MSFSPAIALLASELYSTHGGVQAYTRRLAEILFAYNERTGEGLDCVSLLDAGPVTNRHPQPVHYRSFFGSRGSKPRFVVQSMGLAYRRRPASLVINHPGLAPVGWLLVRSGVVRSYLVVLHGVEAWRRLGWSDRHAIGRASAIVATTNFTAREFCRHNDIPIEKTRVVSLAVSESEIRDVAVHADRQDFGSLKVLTVTRMESIDGYKGVDTLIDAVAQAQARGVRIELSIVGMGNEVGKMKQRAVDRNVTETVHFLGGVTDDRLPGLYRDSDIFALPSRGEGFGIVFLEAMRYGKPCIGGNHGGTPEVIDNTRTGYLVEYGDTDYLTGCLMELAANPGLRARMGEAALRAVRSRYLFRHMQQAWYSLLDELSQFAEAPVKKCMAGGSV